MPIFPLTGLSSWFSVSICRWRVLRLPRWPHAHPKPVSSAMISISRIPGTSRRCLQFCTTSSTITPSIRTRLITSPTHMSVGTHVARICLFLLCESRLLPARMLQSYPADAYGQGTEAGWRTIDLTLARYDRLAQRFERRKARGEQF
ncbi:MAG TPA: hypothetical protein ENI62_05545, partial [Gammaproteobacteria bacterium]|nr:hypothetical protein [Gammaproteobacteria bacterium]